MDIGLKKKLRARNFFPQNKKGRICGHVTHIRCKTCNILGVLQRISVTCPQIWPKKNHKKKFKIFWPAGGIVKYKLKCICSNIFIF